MRVENLTFLVLGPVLRSRTKLREVLRTFVYKSEVRHDRTLVGVSDQLGAGAEGSKIDLLFIAASFGQELITSFLEECRSRQSLLPPVVVFIDDRKLEKGESITALYLDGIDGFISEPYTSEDMLQLIHALVSKGGTVLDAEAKTKRAAEFLVNDAMAKVEGLAVQQMQGEDPGGYALRDLQQLSSKLAKAAEQDPALYGEMLARVFERAKPASEAMLRQKASRAKKRAIHPASVIRDMMRSRKISMERLIQSMRSDPAEIEKLMKEERSVDEALAKDLSRALGMTWIEWIKIQKEYDALSKKRERKER
jgi:plasmid maintenance system antidote protein VapI